MYMLKFLERVYTSKIQQKYDQNLGVAVSTIYAKYTTFQLFVLTPAHSCSLLLHFVIQKIASSLMYKPILSSIFTKYLLQAVCALMLYFVRFNHHHHPSILFHGRSEQR